MNWSNLFSFHMKFSYQYGPPPQLSRKDWEDDKYKLGLSFPNLPYYIEGDLKLTQVMLTFLWFKFANSPFYFFQKSSQQLFLGKEK